MTKPMIPFEAMDPDFIRALRDRYVAREPTARRLMIAASFINDLSRAYLDQALATEREEIRELLLDHINYRPDEPGDFPFDEDDEPAPNYRAPAALLFLYAVAAGYWMATAAESELTRAIVITAYGLEALEMLKPEKTKDDLAREAGLPTTSFTYEKPRDSRTAQKIIEDYFYVQQLCDETDRIAAKKPLDIDALGVALKDYLDALKRYFPAAYELQTAHLCRLLAPAVANAYVEIVKRHDHQKRTA